MPQLMITPVQTISIICMLRRSSRTMPKQMILRSRLRSLTICLVLATGDPAQKENPVIKVDPSRIKPTAATAGTKVGIANDLLIPANGYLIVAKDDGDGQHEDWVIRAILSGLVVRKIRKQRETFEPPDCVPTTSLRSLRISGKTWKASSAVAARLT